MTTRKSRDTVGGHVVRITVLGLAGVTVNRKKCRDSTKKKFHPAPPSQQKAVVAFFSRTSKIKGITTLSKNLTCSPSDFKQQRHVAVWNSSEAKTMGSVVTFEANLTSEEGGEARSFGLTIAMAEDDENDHKVALPFGVATLPIRGDECAAGQGITLDLHVSSLSDADNEKHPILAIQKKTKNDLPRRRRTLQRLFSHQQKINIPTEGQRRAFESTYSMDDGEGILRIHLEVYEKGSDVEKVFVSRRLRGEINEFKSLMPRRESGREANKEDVEAVMAVINQSLATATKEKESMIKFSVFPDDSRDSINRSSAEESAIHGTSAASVSSSCATSYASATTTTSVVSESDELASNAQTIATNEDNLAFEWKHSLIDTDEDDDDDDADYTLSFRNKSSDFNTETDDDEYTLSFEKKSCDHYPETDDDDDYTLSFEKKTCEHSITNSQATPVKDGALSYEIDVFGRRVTIPSCTTSPQRTIKTNVSSPLINSVRGKVQSMKKDITEMTTKFVNSYNKNIQWATGDDDDDYDTNTSASGTPVRDHDSYAWTKKLLCQAVPDTEPILIAEMDAVEVGPLVRHTFSTISAEPL